MAEKEGFEPSRPFWGLHDFQSCALDQTTRLLHRSRIKHYSSFVIIIDIKDEIEKGKPLSAKWLEKADLKELEEVRDSVQKAYLNQELSLETRSHMWDLLPKLDNAIGKKKWAGKPYGYPVKSEHGWHLPSD